MMADGALYPAHAPVWARALRGLRHDVYHTGSYVAFDAAYGGGAATAYIYTDGAHTLLLPLVLRPIPGSRHLDATSPYGYPSPIADTTDADFWAAAATRLPAALADADVVSCFVRLHPLLPHSTEALRRVGRVEYHGDTVSMDLRLTDEQAWRLVRANHRRHINRARRAGHRVVFDDWTRLDDFIALYRQTMLRVGAEPYYHFPPAYFHGLREAIRDEVHLALAMDGEQVLAGGLCFARDGIMQYHLGGTRTERLAEQPSKLVLYEAASWGRERGYRSFHLGSGVGGRDNPLYHFKAGFSDLRHPFHTWRIVVDAAAYAQLTARANPLADPADLSGYFPAYRATQAPALAGV
jgi:hypothetical protein